MKLFKRIFLTVSFLLPVVAGAETIPTIIFNPAPSGLYSQLKVISALSFNPEVSAFYFNVGKWNSNKGFHPKSQASLRLLDQDKKITGTIHTSYIASYIKNFQDPSGQEVEYPQTIDFSHHTKLPKGRIQVTGGYLSVKDAYVTIANQAYPLPVYAEKTYTEAAGPALNIQTKTIINHCSFTGIPSGYPVGYVIPAEDQVDTYGVGELCTAPRPSFGPCAGVEKAGISEESIKGMKLGPNLIPEPNPQRRKLRKQGDTVECDIFENDYDRYYYAWIRVKIGSEYKKILVLKRDENVDCINPV